MQGVNGRHLGYQQTLSLIILKPYIIRTTIFQPDDDIIYFNERIVQDEFQVLFQELDVEMSMSEINKAIKNLKKIKECRARPNYLTYLLFLLL